MSDINNGGPAFPSHGSMGEIVCEGMTLRDYYKAKVLQGLMANPNVVGFNPISGWALVNCDCDDIAMFCESQVDAMIAAREVKS